MENDEPTAYERTTLYEEVWAQPVRTVAARYGVSDVALAKTCRKMAIPLPGRGYWAKKKAGTELPRSPLPALPKGVEPTIVIADIWARRAGVALKAPKEVGAAEESERTIVPDTLRSPHPLVAATRELLKGSGPRDEFVSRRGEVCLDIAVSRGARGRALRLMDALLKALESRGFTVEVVPPKTRVDWYGRTEIQQPAVTRVLVNEEWIHFALTEKRTTVMRTQRGSGGYTYEHREYVPTGRFSLALGNVYWIDSRKTWNDGKHQRLEDCLDDFMDYLPLVAARLRDQRLADERRAAVERERARIRKKAEEYWQEEERRRKDLLTRLERWRLARDIRDYVADLRGCGPVDEDLRWALAYADSVDPAREDGGVEADEVDERADDGEENDDW